MENINILKQLKDLENLELVADNVIMNDGTSVENAIEENKTSILNLQTDLNTTENTPHQTTNGTKEFTCKDGYVDNIKIEGKTKILNANNEEVVAGTSGARLVSVGQGDKIEVLSGINNKKITQLNLGKKPSPPNSDINTLLNDNSTMCTNILSKEEVKDINTIYVPNNFKILYAYSIIGNNNVVYESGWKDSLAQIEIPANVDKVVVSFRKEPRVDLTEVDKSVLLSSMVTSSRYDKKQISTTLRSLPSGLKDEVVKQDDRYYKIKRAGEIIVNGLEGTIEPYAIRTNYSLFSVIPSNIKRQPRGYVNIVSDRFNSVSRADLNNLLDSSEFMCQDDGSDKIIFSILKSKLTEQTVTGFNTWLTSNNVTVVYELDKPILEELPNFNPRTFSDKTTLLLNSGVVQGDADFEVTNSLGSDIDVIKNKLSSIDAEISGSIQALSKIREVL